MKERNSGITLISLVVTIVVLLILASISVVFLWGENGIITRAQEAAFKTQIAKAKEQFNLYLNEKTIQNMEFEKGTLNVGETSLFYNTKEETEQGNIYTILDALENNFVKDFEVIKGEIYYFTQEARKQKWALEMGMQTNPYEIVDGVLISSEKNLSLLDEETGTLTIPERVIAVGEGTFAKLEGVRKIIIPSTCREIKANAFNGNDILEEVVILADGEKGVETIGNYAFNECINLKKISIPNTVRSIGLGIFRQCYSLVDVKLSNKIEVLNIQTFSGCRSLEEIIIPEGVKIMLGYVFQEADNLTRITLPKSLETIESNCFFASSSTLEEIDLSPENQNFIVQNGVLLSKDRTKLLAITKRAIMGNVFHVPDGVDSVGTGLLIRFWNCKKVVIPESVKQIDAGFFPWEIDEIEISENNSTFLSINQQVLSKDKKILYFCYSQAQTITLEEGIEELKNGAVERCHNVTTINFPTTLKKLAEESLKGMNNVRSIRLGKNVEDIKGKAFCYNAGLQEIEIDAENPNFIAENGAVYSKDKTKLIAFINNMATRFEISDGVKEIMSGAIATRTKLTQIMLPQTLKRIEENTFLDCTNLMKIEIPNGVEEMASNIFEGCVNLKEIIIDKPKGSIAGSPWGCIYGDRVVKWL